MRYVDEFRDPRLARQLVEQIRDLATRRWVLMDVCGGQTHSLLRYGIESALQDCIELIHGPGCPVCVTPAPVIDFAQALALRPGLLLASFGDMLRVPGSHGTLLDLRARGGRVQVVYSPLDAVELAQRNPDLQVVFLGVGFETTAPSTALAILQAESLGLQNFSILSAHVRVLPAMEQLMLNAETRVEAFLAAGHVCTIDGFEEYAEFTQRLGVPVVVAGFEPLDLLQAILEAVRLLEQGRISVVNCYARSVRSQGNRHAKDTIGRVYEQADVPWRGFGIIPGGGFRIRAQYRNFDAAARFANDGDATDTIAEEVCLSAEVLAGRIKPPQCPFFGKQCTAEHPLGAPMVSSEGACAAYMRYRVGSLEGVDAQ